ncbi:MAG: RtcB family protein [Anaerolineae bacterium]|nr:RtcB family protein [Anaerolineae bacterium]
MTRKQDFEQVGEFTWELPKQHDGRMQAPARIYGNAEVFDLAFRDNSVEQLVNVATLPGIVKYAMAMPDVHQGYGFPIGGVAAFRYDRGIISPGGVGYDINCGVRMLASTIHHEELQPYLESLTTQIFQDCPSGVGGKGAVRLSENALDQVLEQGAHWALQKGYATQEDIARTEDGGRIPQARAAVVPSRAKERGRPQLGSLGAGNHFLEIDVVEEVYDAKVATLFGLRQGCVVVQIHCGSRGLGHEVCNQYLRVLQDAPQRYGIPIPDRELVAAPVESQEGKDYLAAMAAAANYAFANRQVLAHFVRLAFEKVLAGKISDWHLQQVYDVAHNIAKVETHDVDGKLVKLVVHRKGATRAFAPGHPALPEVYRDAGQPVLVPGSMGTASYVLVGTPQAMAETFGSCCHGAGRTMSRHGAMKVMRGEKVRSDLEQQGVTVRSGSLRGLAEEAPYAYKDVSLVVASVTGAGIARQVARVRPIAVIKG